MFFLVDMKRNNAAAMSPSTEPSAHLGIFSERIAKGTSCFVRRSSLVPRWGYAFVGIRIHRLGKFRAVIVPHCETVVHASESLLMVIMIIPKKKDSPRKGKRARFFVGVYGRGCSRRSPFLRSFSEVSLRPLSLSLGRSKSAKFDRVMERPFLGALLSQK